MHSSTVLLGLSRRGPLSFKTLGTCYEQHVANVLQKVGAIVKVVGGKNDGGIDLRGHWMLGEKHIPLIGQCKRLSKEGGPILVREMEGVVGREDANTLAVIVSTTRIGEAARMAITSSQESLMALSIPDDQMQIRDVSISEKFLNDHPSFEVGTRRVSLFDMVLPVFLLNGKRFY